MAISLNKLNLEDFKILSCNFGGARVVMVIVTGYGHDDTSSIPGQD